MNNELWRQAASAVQSFDAAAVAYDRYRPGFPPELFDDLSEQCELDEGDVAIEVGAGTGIASVELAARRLKLICLEPSPQMAALARAKLQPFEDAVVVNDTFEQWPPTVTDAKIVCAANAWHWVDPAFSWSKAASLLATNGHLALIWHDLIGYEPTNFGRRIAEVARPFNPALATTPSSLGIDDQDTWAARIPASGHFTTPTTTRYRFGRPLDTTTFVATLNTYGINKALDETRRIELDEALTNLIDSEFDGCILKVEDAVLHIARRG